MLLRKLRTATGFSARELAFITEGWFLIWYAEFLLHVRKKHVLLDVMKARKESSEEPRNVARLATLFDVAARNHPLRPACLARAVGFLCILRRRGIEAHVAIGVRRNSDEFDAHAWVVGSSGAVLYDSVATGNDYAELQLPPESGKTPD